MSSKSNSHLKYEEVVDKISGTYVFPSMSDDDEERWENEGEGEGEQGNSMIDGEGHCGKKEIEEEPLIDFEKWWSWERIFHALKTKDVFK